LAEGLYWTILGGGHACLHARTRAGHGLAPTRKPPRERGTGRAACTWDAAKGELEWAKLCEARGGRSAPGFGSLETAKEVLAEVFGARQGGGVEALVLRQ